MCIFEKKAVKIAAASEDPPPNTPLAPAAEGYTHQIPRRYSRLLLQHFFKYVSNFWGWTRFIIIENGQMKQPANILLLQLLRICAYFSLQTLQFCWWGAKTIFLRRRVLYLRHWSQIKFSINYSTWKYFYWGERAGPPGRR